MPKKSYRKILRSIYINLLTLLGIILLLAVIIILSFNSQEFVVHTSNVRTQILETDAAIHDAESKNKTYLLTEDSEHKERYIAAVLLADKKLERLSSNALESAEQNQNIRQLDSLFSLKKAEMNKMVDLIEIGGEQEAVKMVTSSTRLTLKSEISMLIDSMLRVNDSLLNERSDNFRVLYIITILLLLFGIAFMIYGLTRVKTQLIPIYEALNNSNEILNAEIEKRNIEIKLKENQMAINEGLINQLREKNKELNQFAYIASHDLQEPLRTVDNFITIFEEDYGKKLDEEAHTYFKFIKSATTRMRDLINGLLQYSRIGKSGDIETVDLNEVLDEIKQDLSQRISETNAEIVSEVLPTLQGYRLELKQLFYNLLGNSLKFVREGVSPKINVSVYESKNNYQITFTDNGIGIPAKYLTKIFDMFSRLHSEKNYSGQGIGLAFCKKITELHEGIISVDSEEGVGTTFIVILKKNLEKTHE